MCIILSTSRKDLWTEMFYLKTQIMLFYIRMITTAKTYVYILGTAPSKFYIYFKS